MNDLIYQIALTKIQLVGAVTARNLVSYCGGVREIFESKKSQLLKIPGIGEQTAANILNGQVLKSAEQEICFVEKNNITPLFYLEKNYPGRLKHCSDAPVMLYLLGNADLNAPRTIGIVGTRTPSQQGIAVCEELVEGLNPYKPVVISGLAYGIDIAAHRKCLDLGLNTLAVLGHGLSRIYPLQHRKTALDMIGQGGLLTEFPSNVAPDRENFPMRNRIVAGLCDALIVVETAERGGSIITALQANSYNRDVFAVPGRVKDKYSKGCHYLIKNNLAALVENAADVASSLRWPEPGHEKHPRGIQGSLFMELTDPEKNIIDILQQREETGIDQLSYESGLTGSELASLLLNLEFLGMVRALPGKRYILC
jgi:DNA processing protein